MEDCKFLTLKDKESTRDEDGKWTTPLPFRSHMPVLPNNRSQAWRRAQILDTSLRKDKVKMTHFVDFMSKVFNSGAGEVAPTLVSNTTKEVWYIPIFGVYNRKKPNQVRGVFNSSAVYEGISLNKVLMTGPDLTNSPLVILIHFRKDQYAVTADIEQMFYQFYVSLNTKTFSDFSGIKTMTPNYPLLNIRCV
jgi:hypothetical protein